MRLPISSLLWMPSSCFKNVHLEPSATLVLAKFSLNFKSINSLDDAGLYQFKDTLSYSFTKTTTESLGIFSQTTEVLMLHPIVLIRLSRLWLQWERAKLKHIFPWCKAAHQVHQNNKLVFRWWEKKHLNGEAKILTYFASFTKAIIE